MASTTQQSTPMSLNRPCPIEFLRFFVDCIRKRFILVTLLSVGAIYAIFVWKSPDSEWNLYCMRYECCNKQWIIRDIEELNNNLQNELFGQHLAQVNVYGAMKGHVTHQLDRALVLSFHGPTGTGKNHVSRLITESWFRLGMKSKYVHILSGSRHFPPRSTSDAISYTSYLQRLIETETTKCKYSIFIFDEVDSFPPGLLNSIQSYLEYYPIVDGVDYSKTVFLLLSNAGDLALKNITEKYYELARPREDIELVETERIMIEAISNDKEIGLSRSRLIDANLVTHFIPFLPLERRHVRECISAETHRLKVVGNIIEDVLYELQFSGPDDNYSVKGCKNVAEKVSLITVSHKFDKQGRQIEEL